MDIFFYLNALPFPRTIYCRKEANSNNKPFRFTDFFEDAEALANFIENCTLDSEETEPQNAEEDAKL